MWHLIAYMNGLERGGKDRNHKYAVTRTAKKHRAAQLPGIRDVQVDRQ